MGRFSYLYFFLRQRKERERGALGRGDNWGGQNQNRRSKRECLIGYK